MKQKKANSIKWNENHLDFFALLNTNTRMELYGIQLFFPMTILWTYQQCIKSCEKKNSVIIVIDFNTRNMPLWVIYRTILRQKFLQVTFGPNYFYGIEMITIKAYFVFQVSIFIKTYYKQRSCNVNKLIAMR